jgi:endonuclease/exonuclease/phosphatase family metal-dependent hydrolase
MKCCDSGLFRRKEASKMLHAYIDNETKKDYSNFIVLGDWNDDLKDEEGEHCFEPFLNDSRFFFPTADITHDISQASYPKEPYVSFLDHILISKSLIPNSSYDIRTIPIDKYMGSFSIYEEYISDHMPVLLSF